MVKVKSERGSEFEAPQPPRSEEKDLRQALAFMVDEITERFQNNAIEGLTQQEIKKFHLSDGHFSDANFAREFSRLANKVKQKIIQQFSNDRLHKLAEKVIGQTNRANRKRLYNSLERRIGVDQARLIKEEGLTFQANARIEETTQWLKKLRDESLEQFHLNSLHAMAEGRDIGEVVERFKETASKRKNHVKFLARTQIANFNSQMTRLRAEKLGIEKAVWKTARDERVRGCHQARHDKEFNLSEGLYSSCDGKTLWPGSDYNCRCTYRLLIPGDEDS